MIVEDIVWCMGLRSGKSGDEPESAAYGLAWQPFWIVERSYRYNVWAFLMGNVQVYCMESWIFGNILGSCGSAKWAVVSIIIFRWFGQRPSIQKSAQTKHPKRRNEWFVRANFHAIQHWGSISSWKDEWDSRGFTNWGWKTASRRLSKNARLACPGQYFSSTKKRLFCQSRVESHQLPLLLCVFKE